MRVIKRNGVECDVEFDEMQTLSSRTGLLQYPSRRLGKYAMASQRSFMVIVSF